MSVPPLVMKAFSPLSLPAVAARARPRRECAGVRAGIRFGAGDAANLPPGNDVGQVLSGQFGVAKARQRQPGSDTHHDADGQRLICARQLFERDHHIEHAKPHAAQFLAERNSGDAEFADFLEQFGWENAVVIERLGHRRDFALREIGDSRLQLTLIVGEIEVHSSVSLSRHLLLKACGGSSVAAEGLMSLRPGPLFLDRKIHGTNLTGKLNDNPMSRMRHSYER